MNPYKGEAMNHEIRVHKKEDSKDDRWCRTCGLTTVLIIEYTQRGAKIPLCKGCAHSLRFQLGKKLC